MWAEASEEVRLARQALLQAAEAGPVTVRFVGLEKQMPIYQVLNLRGDPRFDLETLRRAAVMSHTRFMLEK